MSTVKKVLVFALALSVAVNEVGAADRDAADRDLLFVTRLYQVGALAIAPFYGLTGIACGVALAAVMEPHARYLARQRAAARRVGRLLPNPTVEVAPADACANWGSVVSAVVTQELLDDSEALCMMCYAHLGHDADENVLALDSALELVRCRCTTGDRGPCSFVTHARCMTRVLNRCPQCTRTAA